MDIGMLLLLPLGLFMLCSMILSARPGKRPLPPTPPVPPPTDWAKGSLPDWEREFLYNLDPSNPVWLKPWHEAFEEEVADSLNP